MTVVVWDGTTLAADRQFTNHDCAFEGTKIAYTLEGEVIAFTGPHVEGLVMMDWYVKGADPANFPDSQKSEHWARLIVAAKHGVKVYENLPYPMPHHGVGAWGSGRDYALGALHVGADAKLAAESACRWSTGCGYGVDALEPQA